MTDVHLLTVGEPMTRYESRVSFDPWDGELAGSPGGQGLVGDESLVEESSILPSSLETLIQESRGEKSVDNMSPLTVSIETILMPNEVLEISIVGSSSDVRIRMLAWGKHLCT